MNLTVWSCETLISIVFIEKYCETYEFFSQRRNVDSWYQPIKILQNFEMETRGIQSTEKRYSRFSVLMDRFDGQWDVGRVTFCFRRRRVSKTWGHSPQGFSRPRWRPAEPSRWRALLRRRPSGQTRAVFWWRPCLASGPGCAPGSRRCQSLWPLWPFGSGPCLSGNTYRCDQLHRCNGK